MAINANEDTELWVTFESITDCYLLFANELLLFSNDALRKHGILPPRPPTPPSPSPPPSPKLEDDLEGLTLSELRELGEDVNDVEVERMIEHFRRQRIADLKKLQSARFGRVYPIGRDEYTREVTEASQVDADDEQGKGKGTGVVCFLYKDG